jgi:hypothetical protein
MTTMAFTTLSTQSALKQQWALALKYALRLSVGVNRLELEPEEEVSVYLVLDIVFSFLEAELSFEVEADEDALENKAYDVALE